MLSDIKSKVLEKETKYLFWRVGRETGYSQNIIIYRIIFKALGKIKILILMFSNHDSNK